MSSSKYVTISVVIPGVTRLLEILQLFESKFNNEFIEELSVNMHDDLERRTTEYFSNPLVICATYLDPRYRKFKFIKDEKKRIEYLEKAKLYIKSTYFAKFKVANEVNELQPPNAKRKRKSKEQNFKLCDENDETDNQVINETAELEMELHNYNKMTVHVSEHSNPLEFYKNNQILLKRLSQFAKLVFSIMASSTPSEETFSNSGDIISLERNRLTPEHAEELVFLSQNKRLGV
jgi:hypothetical protein